MMCTYSFQENKEGFTWLTSRNASFLLLKPWGDVEKVRLWMNRLTRLYFVAVKYSLDLLGVVKYASLAFILSIYPVRSLSIRYLSMMICTSCPRKALPMLASFSWGSWPRQTLKSTREKHWHLHVL